MTDPNPDTNTNTDQAVESLSSFVKRKREREETQRKVRINADGDVVVQEPRRSALSVEEIHKNIQNLSRGPFQTILTEFLGAQPTLENMQAFADRAPDKWAQTIGMFAKLAGYKDEIEVNQNINVQISSMSDSELMDRVRELEEIESGTIDITPDSTEDSEEDRN